jgi:hypothetical protein
MTLDDYRERIGLLSQLPDRETVVETLTMVCVLTLMVVGFSVLITLDVFFRL